jgi:hypothetical protein
MSTPPQNRRLIVYHFELKYQVHGFCGEVDFLKLINKYIFQIKVTMSNKEEEELSVPTENTVRIAPA